MSDDTEQLKIDLAEARGIVFDLDEELNATRVERDRLRDALYIMNLSNVGHVKLIAKLAAERDELKRKRDEILEERDELLWKSTNY
jgi:hypothetical protein